ncbi:MAG TPA: apolipoprotein N-acyltransferase [Asticcacaulis sp.]|nr:apolipoprotein N-acyltransferase [Asticcacaulis sp.]
MTGWTNFGRWRQRAEGLKHRPRLLAALSGIGLALAQPPFCFLPGLLGYAVLMFALEQDLGPRPKRAAYFLGWLSGFLYFLIGCFWVAEAFLVDAKTYGWMAPFAATLLPTGIALFWGAFAVLYRWLATTLLAASRWRFVAFALLFSIFEILRGTVMTGFPWDPSGATWKAGEAMSQTASLVGVYGLGLITVLIFSAPAVVRDARTRKDAWPVGVALGLWIACFAFGEVRLATTVIKPGHLIVRVVQPNIGQRAKWTLGSFDKLFNTYVAMSKAPPKPGRPAPDIIVWPEGALPVTADDLFSQDSWTAPVMARLLDDHQSLIMGVTRQELDSSGRLVWRNSLLFLDRKGGNTVIEGAYNKNKLVPFGEFTPFADITNKLGMKALTHFDDSFTPGEPTKPVQFGSIPRVLPLICYEGIFPGLDKTAYGASNEPDRPRWIVNASNDAWFGLTTGPVQHLNLASYRAIELGLPMVRSTPTGISGQIDPLGRLTSGYIALNNHGFVDISLLTPITPIPAGSQSWLGGGLVWVELGFLSVLIAGFWFFKKVGRPADGFRTRNRKNEIQG